MPPPTSVVKTRSSPADVRTVAGVAGYSVNTRRVKYAVLAVVSFAALAGAAPAWAATTARTGDVWFLHKGAPMAVTRTAPGIQGLVESLLAGPTLRERQRGLTTAIPSGTAIRELEIARRVVTIDLGARFAAGRSERLLHARIGQLVRTLRSIPGVLGVRVRIEGGVPVGLFPAYDLRGTVREPLPDAQAPTLRDVQQLLVDLGFMAASGLTGRPGQETDTAVLAFEKWQGLPRDGVLDDDVRSALVRTARPEPALDRPGKRVEILLRRQVALTIVDGRVERVFHISSGAGGRTPSGSFRVYRKERMSWSVPFSTWMPWATYFVGGIALHEYWPVPTYPASHGCVRMMSRDAPLMYAFATHGTPVDVVWERV
jgi:peptidoglycan hydrolase-like protein with peptidoglycan-binding domain